MRRPAGAPVTLPARAKVNLRFRILARATDGYHAVESLYQRLGLGDVLRVGPAGEEGGIRLTVEAEGLAADDPTPVPSDERNLAWRAAEAFFAATGREPAAELHLVKRIPAGAGLGGGSADAAAALRGLNEVAGRPLGEGELMDVGGTLGTDVAFALLREPAALGWERGRRLLPLPGPPPRPVLIVLGEERVSTPEAYAWIDEAGERSSGAGAAALPPSGELRRWRTLERLAVNDFEPVVFARHPGLRRLRDLLLEAGARIALLAGSGAAVFGVFSDGATRDRAARRVVEAEGVRTAATRTSTG